MITLIDAARKGWRPPEFVSEELYAQIKLKQDIKDPLTAFLGHGLSFGAKWFGGYARGNVSVAASYNGLMRKILATQEVKFTCNDYNEIEVARGDIIYCDPPYKGVTAGYATKSFDSDAFWKWVDITASKGCLIFVSEYSAPEGVLVEQEFVSKLDMRRVGKSNEVIEKLFRVGM